MQNALKNIVDKCRLKAGELNGLVYDQFGGCFASGRRISNDASCHIGVYAALVAGKPIFFVLPAFFSSATESALMYLAGNHCYRINAVAVLHILWGLFGSSF